MIFPSIPLASLTRKREVGRILDTPPHPIALGRTPVLSVFRRSAPHGRLPTFFLTLADGHPHMALGTCQNFKPLRPLLFDDLTMAPESFPCPTRDVSRATKDVSRMTA